MKNPEVIYFEGLPGSGKTTLTTQLAQMHPQTFLVPEYVHPGKDNPASFDSQRFFMENDELKYKAARDSEKQALVDRGHLSTVLYSHAYQQIRGDKDLAYVDGWYVGKILKDRMVPDMYILLDISPELSMERRASTYNPDNNIWDHLEALKYARDSYTRFISAFEPNIPVLALNSATLTIPDLKREIANVLNMDVDYTAGLQLWKKWQ